MRRDAILVGGTPLQSTQYPLYDLGVFTNMTYIIPCCVGEVTFYYYNSLVEGGIFEPYVSLRNTKNYRLRY